MSANWHQVRTATREFAVYGVLILATLATLLPFMLSFTTAFKDPAQFVGGSPLSLPEPWTVENFVTVLGDGGFAAALGTTTITALAMAAVQLPLSVLAAYAFALLRFPLRDTLFWVYIATLLIPATVLVIPLYVLLTGAGLAETFWGLILPTVLGSPYAVFLLRQHFRLIPRDVLDAGRMDGAGPIGILVHIVAPLSRPTIAALALITIVAQWNAFLWPRIIAGTDWRVLTVATAALQDQRNPNWTLVMAATTLALLPMIVLFLLFQRQLTRAITLGAP